MAITPVVSGSPPVAESPLSHDEAAAIDSLPWPLLERQRLRLLAHSLRSLQALGVELFQGYHFCRPMPADALIQMAHQQAA